MKKLLQLLICLFLLIRTTSNKAGFWSHVASQLSSAFSPVASFAEGMAQGFGMDPSGYHTNLKVFNNSDVPIEVCLRKVKQVMGMNFHSGTRTEASGILPGEDTGDKLHDVSLYLEIVLRASSDQGKSYHELFSDTIASQEPQYHDCKDTYIYNYYTDPHGVKTEYLGFNKGMTDQFFGQIYNGLSEPCYVRYTFDKETFTVLLEPDTFNFLQSDSDIPKCMRPGKLLFTFADGSTQEVELTAQGLGNQVKKGIVTPMQYHYEIYKNAKGKPYVYTMGLGIGNYKPCVNGDVRLIGPVTCAIWNKSADQVTKYPDYVSIESPERTVWFGYGTPGWANITTGVKNVIIGTIPYGQAAQFKIVRPTVWPYKATTALGFSLITQKLTARDMLPIKNVNVDPYTQNVTASFCKRQGRFLSWGMQAPSKLNETESQEKELLGQLLHPVNLHIYMDAISSTTAKAPLYVMSLNTADEKKARRYMEKLVAGELKYDYERQDATIKTIENDVNALTQHTQLSKTTENDLGSETLKIDYGIIYDAETGISGHPLIIDSFIPYGKGLGTYYYSVEPPVQNISLEKLKWLQTYLKQDYFKDSGNGAAFTPILEQWITKVYQSATVMEGIKSVYPDIVNFLLENGADTLFNVNNGVVDRKNLGPLGNYVLTTLIAGPSSIINAPLLWSSGMSWYLISGASKPTDETVTPPVSLWTPTKTIIFNTPSSAFAKVSDQTLGLGEPYTYSASVRN